MSEQPVLHVKGLNKKFGERWALHNINFVMQPGEILGFVGPNGSGKTTLIKIIAGLCKASAGEITVLGQQLSNDSLKTPTGLGVVMEEAGFIPYMSGHKNLAYLAQFGSAFVNKDSIVDLMRRVGLDPEDERPVRAYSLGMRQRLNLAQALMEAPKLILLDEPANGIDPAGIVRLRELLLDLAQKGTAILMSSHLLTEVERICQRVIFVKNGSILKEISLGSDETSIVLIVPTVQDSQVVESWSKEQGIHCTVREQGSVLKLEFSTSDCTQTVPDIVRSLVNRDVKIEAIYKTRHSLEFDYMELIH